MSLIRTTVMRGFAVGVGVLLCAPALHAAGKDKPVDFNRQIRPLLSDNCFHCHGPDEKARKAKLRLDTPAGAVKDLGGYQAIKPHDLKASELWKRINAKKPDEVMPPPATHKKLKPEQIELLGRWIEQGGEYRGHWAFIPPVRPAIPTIKNSPWARNSIDNFIAAKFEAKGLKPAPEASREVLIRRLTLDLTGLPPTLAEVDAFVADQSPDAYEKLVDHLLDSPHFGEQMASHWLDAARYGDTHGLHLDNELSLWPYRDWVVKAFNQNLPFDQFTIQQLAGDLLPNATRDQQIASGFNRCNVTSSEGGSINEELLARYAVDRTTTTAAVWMGLTAGCAVCHDHKFDPLTQKEFYQMYAFFNSASDPAMDGNILLTPPILKLSTPDQQQKLNEFNKNVDAAKEKVKEALAAFTYSDPSTNNPAPPIQTVENIWVEDDFPAGAKVKNDKDTEPLKWVTAETGKVYSGKRAIKRSAKGVAEDFFDETEKPLFIPTGGKLFAYVYLEPNDLPKAVMLQFNVDGKWEHRAVWGDVDAIDLGKKETKERFHAGKLPASNEWVRLEVDASKLGLKAGTKVQGLAFTQSGGTVFWDKAGIIAKINPAKDPLYSQIVWEKENQGKSPSDVPKAVQDIFRSEKPKERKPEENQVLHDYFIESVYADSRSLFDPLNDTLKSAEKKRDEFDKTIPATLIMKDMDKPRDSFVLIRGQYNKTGARVTPNVPAIFPPLPKSDSTNRLSLARWLVDPQHPLTARVTVNRFWQQFFGSGIVKTAGDFGSQGEPPSHPELLDWLATTFTDSGWDMKKLCKLIVTSATYRQDSKVTAKVLQIDPENRLLSHGPRFRLEAETIRDNALFVSGLLNLKMGGKAVKPYQPVNIWEPVAYSGSDTREYKQDSGDALYRRTLYTFWKRTAPPPALTTFDAPSRESFCVRRERSNTPLQALLLMNDTQHVEAARHLAERLLTEGGEKPEERLIYGFRICTARKPTRSEQSILLKSLQQQLAKYKKNPDAAKQLIAVGDSKPPEHADAPELAAYTLVASVLLNLDETLNCN